MGSEKKGYVKNPIGMGGATKCINALLHALHLLSADSAELHALRSLYWNTRSVPNHHNQCNSINDHTNTLLLFDSISSLRMDYGEPEELVYKHCCYEASVPDDTVMNLVSS